MKIVYSTVDNGHSTHHLEDAKIPKHAAIFVQVGETLFQVYERDGSLEIHTQNQIVIRAGVSNVIRLDEEKF